MLIFKVQIKLLFNFKGTKSRSTWHVMIHVYLWGPNVQLALTTLEDNDLFSFFWVSLNFINVVRIRKVYYEDKTFIVLIFFICNLNLRSYLRKINTKLFESIKRWQREWLLILNE